MSPQDRREFEELKRIVDSLVRVENVQFLESLRRRFPLPIHKLSDHSDVSLTDGASTGEVLKKTATTWQPGTDNT